jgi:short subunit dehydrogenase-like uncharacterized protein
VSWLLYGANGYTGRLIALEARRRGVRPVLAGRRREEIEPLARQLGCEARVFALDDTTALDAALRATGTVLLAAGPFSATSRPVLEACLRTGANYLDISGEVQVFESVFKHGEEARAGGCVVLPGVGFDVVPSDCLAARLKQALPEATHLELALAGGRLSRGTARTMVEGLRLGGAVRLHGDVRREPLLARVREARFRDRTRKVASIPWGDVSTAYYSTGIPNIVVYRAVPRRAARWLPVVRALLPLAGLSLAQRGLRGVVDRRVQAPTAAGPAQLWGRVADAHGRSVEGTLTTPEAYHLTGLTAVECAERVSNGAFEPGVYTPSLAFGADFITEFEGCDLRVPS